MRVFLTGVTGFVGSAVARALVSEGFAVSALVQRNVSTWRIDDILPRLNTIEGDLDEYELLKTSLKVIKPEVCVHLAWYAEPRKYLESLENVRLLTMSLNLASQLADAGCRRLIAVGSCFEYDTSLGYLSEKSALKPTTLYAATKLSLQITLERLTRNTGMELAWPRLFHLYGPCEDERRLIPYTICSLLRSNPAKLTKGDQVRDFLHIEDVAAAFVAIINSGIEGVVNIGSGNPVTVKEIANTIGAITGRTDLIELGAVPYRKDDPAFICANNAFLLNNTGWSPQYELQRGLEQTIAWWRKHLENRL